jgi:signal transduction histidine kinase
MSGIILAEPQEQRRNRLASLVLLRRLATYNVRIGLEKVAMVAIAIAITLASEQRIVGWLALLPALVGTALNLLALHVTQGAPRGRLLRRYEAHLSTIEGHPQLNLPAFVECLGAVGLIVAGAWAVTDLPDVWRLVYVAVGTAYACLVSCSIFDDNAWYNPDVRSPTWQEIDRVLCGVQICALVLAVSWWAPWQPSERIGLVVVAAIGFIVPLRAGATQLLVADLEPLVEAERQRGTRLVIEETARELLPILTELRQLAAELGPDGASVQRLAESALSGVADIPNQVAHSVTQGEGQPLQVVAERLISLAGAAGRDLTVTLPPNLNLVDADRRLASQAMRDLAGNAISASATRIYIELRQIGPRLVVLVADDGRPIPDGAWKSAGSSSAELESKLAARGGTLSVEMSNLNKVVMATWVLAG